MESIVIGARIAADSCSAFDVNPRSMVKITITSDSITFGPAPDCENDEE